MIKLLREAFTIVSMNFSQKKELLKNTEIRRRRIIYSKMRWSICDNQMFFSGWKENNQRKPDIDEEKDRLFRGYRYKNCIPYNMLFFMFHHKKTCITTG